MDLSWSRSSMQIARRAPRGGTDKAREVVGSVEAGAGRDLPHGQTGVLEEMAYLAHYCGKELQATSAGMMPLTVARLDAYSSPDWQRVVSAIPQYRRLRQLIERSSFVIAGRSADIQSETIRIFQQLFLDHTAGTQEALQRLEKSVAEILARTTY